MGLTDTGWMKPGTAADLLLFRARGMTELLSRAQGDRIMLRHGRVLEAGLPDWRDLHAVLGTGPG